MSRDYVLGRVRSALGRTPGQALPEPPPVWIDHSEASLAEKVVSFRVALERLSGVVHEADSPTECSRIVGELIHGKTAVASNAPILHELQITSLPGVSPLGRDYNDARHLCANADFGISGATFALAATGTLVIQFSAEADRLVSLLPPVHIAVVRKSQLLTDLFELINHVPKPLENSSGMILITGPSRTGDIEQILVRGVHGPGTVHVVLL